MDSRLVQALVVADEWRLGIASVGQSREASVSAHDVARESLDPTVIAGRTICWSCGCDGTYGRSCSGCGLGMPLRP